MSTLVRFLGRCFIVSLLTLIFGAGAAVAQTSAYVASSGANRVDVVDTATNAVTATISGTGSRHLTFSRDGAFLFSATSNAVQVINTATNTIAASIPTGNNVTAVAESNNGYLYSCNNASGTVSVIDRSTYTVVSTFSLFCQSLASTPDGSAIWVSHNNATTIFPSIAVIDPATNTIATTFALGAVRANAAAWIAFSPDGALAYASNFPANNVSVINTATHATVAVVPVGSLPTFVAVSPDGAFAYAANLTANNISVISTATNTVVATVPVGGFPRAVAFTPDGAFAYVTNFNSNSVSVIDTATLTVVATLSGFSRPWGVALTPNQPPVAKCHNVTVSAGPSCSANASIDNGSYDPDAGDAITLAQSPAGPYALGTTNVTLTVTDNHGAASSCQGTVTVVDTTPPAITCPAPITVNGCLSGGATVSFTVSATDSCDASPTIVTTPPSGSLFAVGTTPVTATATDHSGNSAQCGFTVTVQSPQDQIAALIAQINTLVTAGSLSQSNANPLLNTLSNAAKHLANGQVSQTQKEIGDFIKKVAGDVNTGKLAPADGQALINAAQAFGANLGC